jgi:ribokinase
VVVADLQAISGEPPVVLVLQLEVPLAEAKAAAVLGRSRGWHVLLNPAPAAPIDAATLAAVDTLVANEHEAAQLTGMAVDGIDSACSAAARLLELGCRTVAVTLGDRGAVLVSRLGAWHAAAPRVQAIDTTAAGDAFVGALAVSILQGLDLPDALRLAVATGSLAVTRKGAQPSLPAHSEAVELAATVSVTEIASAQNSGHHATAQSTNVNSWVGGDGTHSSDAVNR